MMLYSSRMKLLNHQNVTVDLCTLLELVQSDLVCVGAHWWTAGVLKVDATIVCHYTMNL